MAEIDAAVGTRVRALRGQRQMSQGQLAEAMQISQARLSQLEKGEAWSLDNVDRAAKGLRVSARDLLPDGTPPELGPVLDEDLATLVRLVHAARSRPAVWMDALDHLLRMRKP